MWFEYFNIARKVLVAHKFRSFLTVLSITIGAFSIVTMSSLAQSGSATLFHDLQDLGGGRLIAVFGRIPERAEGKAASYTRGLTVPDRDVLFSSVPHLEGHTYYTRLGNKDLIADNGNMYRARLFVTDGDWFDINKLEVGRGRFYTEEENRRHGKLCVVGHKTALALWDGEAVGHTMQIGALRCRVVGQSGTREFFGKMMGLDRLDYVAVPFETMADLDVKVAPGAQIILKTDAQAHNDIVKRVGNAILSERHHGVDDFQIFDFSRFTDQFTAFFRVLSIIVGFIAGIALLVGGVGVMNMMLVSVSERVREIGIRKAIGANPSDIGRQFLLEAIVLAGAGGLIGVVSGVGMALAASTVIRHFKERWITVIASDAVVAALCVSVGVGLLFGYFPARRAAKLDAVAAMRGA